MKSFLRFSTFAFFVFCTSSVFAQCDYPVKGKFFPMVAQTDNLEEVKGELWLVGYQPSEGTIFPYYFEWRQENHLGSIIQKGKVRTSFQRPDENFTIGKITDLKAGKYVLITYDSSFPCKTDERAFEIK